MEPLAETIVINGMKMKQIQRNGMVAIYEMLEDKYGNHYPNFEVIKIQTGKERKIEERIILAGEMYPSPRDWGQTGWTYKTRQSAMQKYAQLLQPIT